MPLKISFLYRSGASELTLWPWVEYCVRETWLTSIPVATSVRNVWHHNAIPRSNYRPSQGPTALSQKCVVLLKSDQSSGKCLAYWLIALLCLMLVKSNHLLTCSKLTLDEDFNQWWVKRKINNSNSCNKNRQPIGLCSLQMHTRKSLSNKLLSFFSFLFFFYFQLPWWNEGPQNTIPPIQPNQ